MSVQTPRKLIETFLMLFGGLKSVVGNVPERLPPFYNQHSGVKEATDKIYQFLRVHDFERRVFRGAKVHRISNSEHFQAEYHDFDQNWMPKIIDAIYPEIGELFTNIDIETLEAPSIEAAEGIRPDPETDDEFDPSAHNGSEAVGMVFWAAQSRADDDDGSEISNASKIGLDAFDYLTGTIGLNVEDVFRRWRMVPIVFMPDHVSIKHSVNDRGSIHELLSDAVRAYVFGASAACIFACRATLEAILKEHYELDYQYIDGRGRTRDKGLAELIVLADEKYEFVQGKRIQRLADRANHVMHAFAKRAPLNEDDEKTLLEFIKTIKFLIERAPET
ncbi:MAG: hypothetical protein ACFE0S_18070 [Rhodospirillales bacterium]